ncbi:hypothetical protein EWM64_g7372 [Hericium alpestre]|uniref:Yeast cell wall synthesis Kre9/Knh1-like N-terminal domain-containing protein n=1 Tax=Hericium alpestre TaxID=135208 RepID=A0A4Y9ZRI4_9AGAM|nr:hypothetical protein EWM64_g7372 [Hericium alpestre]
MFSSTLLAVVLAISPVAFGKLFTTSPVASTTFPAGQPATVNWQDDGSAPNLQAFGPSDIGLFTGSVNQQVLLQSIATAVDVSKQNTIQWTPNANVGPDGSKYFIRFTSNGLKDPAQPNFNFPAEAFSAMFTSVLLPIAP